MVAAGSSTFPTATQVMPILQYHLQPRSHCPKTEPYPTRSTCRLPIGPRLTMGRAIPCHQSTNSWDRRAYRASDQSCISNLTQFSSRYRTASRKVYFQRGCMMETREGSHQNGQLQQLPRSLTGKPQILVPNVPLLPSKLSISIPRNMTKDRNPIPPVLLAGEHIIQRWKSPSVHSPQTYKCAFTLLPREDFADLRQIVTRLTNC
jgi:hypothetical protein